MPTVQPLASLAVLVQFVVYVSFVLIALKVDATVATGIVVTHVALLIDGFVAFVPKVAASPAALAQKVAVIVATGLIAVFVTANLLALSINMSLAITI